LYKVHTPYKPAAWKQALQEARLKFTFPHLVHDITYGAPISNPLLLSHMFILHNLKSAKLDPIYMDKFLEDEVAASRIDSPFSIQDAHIIFDGHFCMAPLGFVEKPGSTTLQLICHHSKEDHAGFFTNGWLDPSIRVIRFYTASDAADFMSILFYLHFPYLHPFGICAFFIWQIFYSPCYTFYLCHGGSGV